MIGADPNPYTLRKLSEALLPEMFLRTSNGVIPGMDEVLFPASGKVQDPIAPASQPGRDTKLLNDFVSKPLDSRIEKEMASVLNSSLRASIDSVAGFCGLDTCQIMDISHEMTASVLNETPQEHRRSYLQSVCSCRLNARTQHVPGYVQVGLALATVGGLVLCPATGGVGCAIGPVLATAAGVSLTGTSAANTVASFGDLSRVTTVNDSARALPGLTSGERADVAKRTNDSAGRAILESAGTAFAGATSISPATALLSAARPLPKSAPLTADQARHILRGLDPDVGLPVVIHKIGTKKYTDSRALANDLDTMFAELQRSSGWWQYKRVAGSDGSIVFTGSIGHAVVVSPSGQVYKGLVDPEFFTTPVKVWPANYSKMKSIVPAIGAAP
jgi:hypothetical protein